MDSDFKLRNGAQSNLNDAKDSSPFFITQAGRRNTVDPVIDQTKLEAEKTKHGIKSR